MYLKDTLIISVARHEGNANESSELIELSSRLVRSLLNGLHVLQIDYLVVIELL